MNLSFRKIVAFFLILDFLFGYIPLSWSQTTQGGLVGGDASRIGGSSFGNRGTSALPSGSGSVPQIFQEPTFSGLTYQVHILGEVNKPGTYRINASTRLSEALEKAGGISGIGSERRIEVRRKEGGGRSVDLLSFKQFGNLDANPYLLDNDVVFVPLKGWVVQIAGTIKRPGTYELTKEKTLEDLVRLVGGMTPGVSSSAPIKVVRFLEGKRQIIDVVDSAEARKRFILENADVVVVPHFITENKKFDYNLASLPGDNPLFYPSYEERVFVLGAVAKPGPYPYTPYYNLRQFLTLAGGTTKLAKSGRIKVVNSEGKVIKASANLTLNPGDTIVVPEKYLPPEGILSLVLGITTSVLGITTTILTLTR